MEEKKVLNEEETEEVSGGRYLAEKEFAGKGKLGRITEWWPNALPADLAKFAGKELSKELLDSVSGGEMSDVYMAYLDFMIQGAKERGYTLDRALQEMQQCGASQEDINYVATHW